MRIFDVFSGLGGFSLAATWAGMEVAGQCEIETFCRRVLRHHFPKAWLHDDIRTLTGDLVRDNCGRIDLVCGGPPCQPASVAGKRQGESDVRWLWPDAIRIVRELRPQWVVFENPAGIVSLKPKGLAWIISELQGAGYLVSPVIMGADDIGAPHRRKRIWVVGKLADPGCGTNNGRTISSGMQRARQGESEKAGGMLDISQIRQDDERGARSLAEAQGRGESCNATVGNAGQAELADNDSHEHRQQEGAISNKRRWTANGCQEAMANADSSDGDRRRGDVQVGRRGRESATGENDNAEGDKWLAESGVGCPIDDVPGRLVRFVARPGEDQKAWEAPRVAKGIPERSAKLKALGNAIVPECAFQIFSVIMQIENQQPVSTY